MKECVRHGFRPQKILRPSQQARDRVVLRQRFERAAETLQIRRRHTDFEQAAILLHHIDSGPAVARVDHQAHRAARSQDVAKGAKTVVRIGQVVQHSRTNHQIERATNLSDALDREPMQFEILQIVLALKIARVAKARVADVDRRDSSMGLAQRVPRGLRSAASSNKDIQVSPRSPGGPDQMELGSATVPVLVEVAVRVQIRERGGIGHPFVEVADFLAAVHLGPPRMSDSGGGYSARTRLDAGSTWEMLSNVPHFRFANPPQRTCCPPRACAQISALSRRDTSSTPIGGAGRCSRPLWQETAKVRDGRHQSTPGPTPRRG